MIPFWKQKASYQLQKLQAEIRKDLIIWTNDTLLNSYRHVYIGRYLFINDPIQDIFSQSVLCPTEKNGGRTK